MIHEVHLADSLTFGVADNISRLFSGIQCTVPLQRPWCDSITVISLSVIIIIIIIV